MPSLFVASAEISSFNRYMVECECVLLIRLLCQKSVLIDTWWNVNKVRAKVFEEGKAVLIDTWWNVNLKRGYITQQELEVLIDTWWNVNVEVSGIVLSVSLF